MGGASQSVSRARVISLNVLRGGCGCLSHHAACVSHHTRLAHRYSCDHIAPVFAPPRTRTVKTSSRTQADIQYIGLCKPRPSIDGCRCAHGISTACGHSCFCFEIHFRKVHCNKSSSRHSSRCVLLKPKPFSPHSHTLTCKHGHMHSFCFSCWLQGPAYHPSGQFHPPVCTPVYASNRALLMHPSHPSTGRALLT